MFIFCNDFIKISCTLYYYNLFEYILVNDEIFGDVKFATLLYRSRPIDTIHADTIKQQVMEIWTEGYEDGVGRVAAIYRLSILHALSADGAMREHAEWRDGRFDV